MTAETDGPEVYEGLYRLAQVSLRALWQLFGGLEVVGRHHLPDYGGCLLVANHTSFLDPAIVGSVYRSRRVEFLARDTLFEHALFGRLIRRLGSHPVQRGAGDRRAVRTCVTILRAGRPLLLFPEGTRSADGRVQTFQRGFLLIARQAGAPVVPVGIRGAYDIWPRNRRLPRPHRIRVEFGRPIEPPELAEIDAGGVRERVAMLAGSREPVAENR